MNKGENRIRFNNTVVEGNGMCPEAWMTTYTTAGDEDHEKRPAK